MSNYSFLPSNHQGCFTKWVHIHCDQLSQSEVWPQWKRGTVKAQRCRLYKLELLIVVDFSTQL